MITKLKITFLSFGVLLTIVLVAFLGGFFEQSKKQSIYLKINGMNCAGCVVQVEKAIKLVPGVSNVQVNGALAKAKIEMKKNLKVDTFAIMKAVLGSGLRPELVR